MDVDKDGKLDKNDIGQLVHEDTMNINKLDIQKMIEEADLDGDVKIEYG
jgi:Ca2+-binding EF-hand superfamily protein